MNTTPRGAALGLLLLALSVAWPAAADTLSLDQLLKNVQQGQVRDNKANAARIKEFQENKNRQTSLLAQTREEKKKQEQQSEQLEAQFENNDKLIVELEVTLKERLGTLKELFGVLQQAAGDARGQFEDSVTHIQYPERTSFLNEFAKKMGQTNHLASLDEINRIWFELQREMTESGKVVRFSADIITADGQRVTKPATRIGVFSIISDGKYLEYIPETGRLVELPRQPQARFLGRLRQFEEAPADALTGVAIDPSRGQILALLVQEPNLAERIDQGGVVGYIIIALGLVALLVVLERFLMLSLIGFRTRWQATHPDKPGNNPLGRVFKVYHDNPATDTETLELKLSEAILKERPGLSRRLGLLKIISIVAPLLGLLGTVVGMIITFQAITLFGTGDPKLMAGGISQALVTTVLGLCVAIPTVLLHAIVSSRSRAIIQILEEQATGMVAQRSEQAHTARGD